MHYYAHTLGAIPSNLETPLLNQHIDAYLFSLIMGLRQGSFGHNTVIKAAKYIRKLKATIGNDKTLMIDSGGYSIIVGDVPYRNIKKCIECYNYYLESFAKTDCEYILSLDIPIFLNEQKNNTSQNIYNWNYESIKQSKQILEKNPELYQKFIYVWHFKILKQFNIWRNVYDNFFRSDQKIVNHAIGGLVSLRGITNINFSPFLIPAYKVLKLIHDANMNQTSILHILGVYHKYDRFILSFMSDLFNNVYLKNKNPNVKLTFDTVNYTISGLYKIREMPVIIMKGEDDIFYSHAHEIEDEIDYLIADPNIRTIIKDDLFRIQKNKQLNNPKLVSLLMVIYNQMSDKIMTKMIKDENLLDLFLTTKNPNNFINQFTKIFNKWETKYPFIFRGQKNNLTENFRWLKSAHELWEMNIDESKWDQCVIKFAKKINFPFDLAGEFIYDA